MLNGNDKAWLGIDPGQTGCACLLTNGRIWFHDFLSISKANDMLCMWSNQTYIHACLEKVHSMPRDGHVGAFKFGANYGAWEALLISNHIEYDLVSPQKWKNAMIPSGMRKIIKDKKEQSLKTVYLFYPELKTKLYLKKHHNRAEALLLATFIKNR